MFEADRFALSLNVERGDRGNFALLGQVLSEQAFEAGRGHARLTARDGDGLASQATLGSSGSFDFLNLPAGVYQLVVSLGDERIVVPILTLDGHV